MAKGKIVIGLDPGKNNFGVAVVEFKGNRQPKIVHLQMLEEAIKNLLHGFFEKGCRLFRRVVVHLFNKYRPWRIIVERFLTRFRGFGNTGELIGIMIGIIWSVAKRHKVKMLLTTAASWKNQFSRDTKIDLKGIYQTYKPIPVHCMDASLIAVYGNSKVATYQRLNLAKFFQPERQRWLTLKQKK